MENNNNPQQQFQQFWDAFAQSFDPNQQRQRAGPSAGPQSPFSGGHPFNPMPFNWGPPDGPWGPWGPSNASRHGPWGHGPWGTGRPQNHEQDRASTQEHHSDANTYADTSDNDAADPPTPTTETMREAEAEPSAASHDEKHDTQTRDEEDPSQQHHADHHHNHRHHGPGAWNRHSSPWGFPGGPRRGRAGGCGRGRGRGHMHGRGHGRMGSGPRGPWGPPPPPPPPYAGAFDFRPLMHAFESHPLAQVVRDCFDQTSGVDGYDHSAAEDKFVPPVDIFNTEKAYVLHVALPGAAKEDVGVHWDAEKGHVNVAGVIYRPGNEEFLQCLTSSERKVGMFEKTVKLPPPGIDDKDEIDGYAITAKMENGVLVITVPKAEKEWTEIHKVDIQ